jgi:hypothetical protein
MDGPAARRNQLADYLKDRRTKLDPAAFGFAAGVAARLASSARK